MNHLNEKIHIHQHNNMIECQQLLSKHEIGYPKDLLYTVGPFLMSWPFGKQNEEDNLTKHLPVLPFFRFPFLLELSL